MCFAVGGASLTQVLERGVRPDMDRALTLLKRKRAAAEAAGGSGVRAEIPAESAALEA